MIKRRLVEWMKRTSLDNWGYWILFPFKANILWLFQYCVWMDIKSDPGKQQFFTHTQLKSNNWIKSPLKQRIIGLTTLLSFGPTLYFYGSQNWELVYTLKVNSKSIVSSITSTFKDITTIKGIATYPTLLHSL